MNRLTNIVRVFAVGLGLLALKRDGHQRVVFEWK